jgi:hypothetical protein
MSLIPHADVEKQRYGRPETTPTGSGMLSPAPALNLATLSPLNLAVPHAHVRLPRFHGGCHTLTLPETATAISGRKEGAPHISTFGTPIAILYKCHAASRAVLARKFYERNRRLLS